MTETRIYHPTKAQKKPPRSRKMTILRSISISISDPDSFWAEQGKRIDWIKPYSQISDVSYQRPDVHIKWFADGTLNASANCLDRHLAERGDQTAIIWEGDDPAESRHITYKELHRDVCKFANALKAGRVKKATGSLFICR